MPDLADFFINVLGGEVVFVPAPRVNVDEWLRFWQSALDDPSHAGFVGAVQMLVAAEHSMLEAAADTLGNMYDDLNALAKRAADVIMDEVRELRGAVAAYQAILAATHDVSVLHAGIVVPSIHAGPKGAAARIASVANQVEYLAPAEVHWEWGGVFGGTASLKPAASWDIYAGVAKAMTGVLVQLEESAPGEAKTLADRLIAAGTLVRKALEATGPTLWEILIGAAAAVFVVRKLKL